MGTTVCAGKLRRNLWRNTSQKSSFCVDYSMEYEVLSGSSCYDNPAPHRQNACRYSVLFLKFHKIESIQTTSIMVSRRGQEESLAAGIMASSSQWEKDEVDVIVASSSSVDHVVEETTTTTTLQEEDASVGLLSSSLLSIHMTHDVLPQDTTTTTTRERVSRASYPIPQPLSRLLAVAMMTPPDDATVFKANPSHPQMAVDREDMESALTHLVGNAFHSLDAMYFATSARVRNRPSFAHRLCLRVSTDVRKGILEVTDLGAGMTRADLINSLGIGRLSPAAHAASKQVLASFHPPNHPPQPLFVAPIIMDDDRNDIRTIHSTTVNHNDDSSSSSSNGPDDSGEEDKVIPTQNGTRNKAIEKQNDNDTATTEQKEEGGIAVPCRSSDIGGFYAAICALGVGVNVGTKSKFDDYYEFEVGMGVQRGDPNNNTNDGVMSDNTSKETEESSLGISSSGSSEYSHFFITRPMEEGVMPLASNGFVRFSDVRGESGTRVTIQLSQRAIEAGMLDEEHVLKPMLVKFFETSQYSVAFSSYNNGIVVHHEEEEEEVQSIIDASQRELEDQMEEAAAATKEGSDANESILGDLIHHHDNSNNLQGVGSHSSVKERSKFIPLRLSMGERKMLRLVEAIMTCCDYTTDVDRPWIHAARRTHAQLKGVTAVLRGMVTACDYAAGQKLCDDDNDNHLTDLEPFFRQMFEIARRHKIMNPEKMRTEYGKLIYLLQDAVSPTVAPHMSFSCKGPIETVYNFLEDRDGLAVLDDPLIEVATQEILAEKKTRANIDEEIRRKEMAVSKIKSSHRNINLTSDDIHLCLYSICDNNSFLNSNRVPIDKVIGYLQDSFAPGNIEEGYSLSIVSGQDGARLSHSHERQYYFALQSLSLWRDIVDDMFRLWHFAEEDLLSETITYSLKDTGQGMQRVQQSPRTYKAMQQILVRVQGKMKQWIGSGVIHLGDHNVPNALSFIDKYTQVPRILGPIVSCLENLERIYENDDGIKEMVDDGFGGLECLKKDILYDFFRSAFDGSGADNFYDAGSCIDGRMTSAWHWCSQLPTKPFYSIFKLTGFTGFDGEFK